jgi:hypothetical protein
LKLINQKQMKHFILTTVAAFFISIGIFAQSNLIVFSDDGIQFTLEVNGVQQNEIPTTNVKVEGINQEYISTRILFTDGKTPALKKSFQLTKNSEVSARIVLNNKGVYKLRYMGETPISSPMSNTNQTVINYGEEPVAVSDPSPTTLEPVVPSPESTTSTTVTTTTINTGTPANSESVSMNVNLGGQSVGISNSISGMESTSSSTVTETTTVTTSSSTSASLPIPSPQPTGVETVSNGGCDSPMPSGELNSALASMDSKSFEDSKMTLAKQFTRANCLSADQIKMVMQKFTYEASKLDYSKYAYEYCFDQPSYYTVNDAFDFELTIDELNEFLESK